MSNYSIRRFRTEDSAALHALTVDAIETIGPARYSDDQIAVWSGRHNNPSRLAELAPDGVIIFVAVDECDVPAAFALLEPDGHLDQLYCSPAHSRNGLPDRLLAAAEDHASALSISRLYTEASELARPAFERAGYAVTHRRDFDLDGVTIHNYAMEKLLR